MQSNLNTDRLHWLPAQIPPPPPDDVTALRRLREDAGNGPSTAPLLRNSARRAAPSQLAVWRPNRGLHNKERAHDDKPLTSANSSRSPSRSARAVDPRAARFSHHAARRSASEARQFKSRRPDAAQALSLPRRHSCRRKISHQQAREAPGMPAILSTRLLAALEAIPLKTWSGPGGLQYHVQ